MRTRRDPFTPGPLGSRSAARRPLTRRSALLGGAGLMGLGLAACSGGDGGSDGGGSGGGDTITLGYIPSWTDGLSTLDAKFTEALSESGELSSDERASRNGLRARQVTLR